MILKSPSPDNQSALRGVSESLATGIVHPQAIKLRSHPWFKGFQEKKASAQAQIRFWLRDIGSFQGMALTAG